MSTTATPLLAGNFYHVYNRGNNGEALFYSTENYKHFLKLLAKYSMDSIEYYAYCLMKNHFHLLIRICDRPLKQPHRILATVFNAYAQAINRQENRKGSLFLKPFRRKLLQDESYRAQVVYYIHANPVHHGVVKDFRIYPYSSYKSILSDAPTKLKRTDVLAWFGGREGFIEYHNRTNVEIAAELCLE